MEGCAPATALAGTTDRAVAQLITYLNAAADPESDGIEEDIAAMDGMVRVSEVVN